MTYSSNAPHIITREDILKEKIERELSRRHLVPFAKRVYPRFEDPRHIKFFADVLERAERREEGYTRIIMHMPPQHGKSTLSTKILPAWWMGRNPYDDVISTSYAASLALKHSAVSRQIVGSQFYQQIFPGIYLAPDSKAKNQWNIKFTNEYGELVDGGSFTASGILGGITGRGADLMLIDDPIKNRAEAESPLLREKIIDEYISTLSTRLHKDSVVIVPMTRWHQGDLAGWLLKESGENYNYIRLPGLAERKGDPLGRRSREVLWGSHFPMTMLKKKRRMMGAYNWFSMYQGLPRPPEGGLLKKGYFQRVDYAPPELRWVRYWDLAVSEDRKADYTASIKAGMDLKGNIYLTGLIRDRWEWPDVRDKIIETCKAEKGVAVGVESNQAQKGMVQTLWRDPALLATGIIGIPSIVDKTIRAIPLSTRGAIGKLYIVKGDWNDEFLDECVDFPNGEHDDQVDCATGCMALLAMYFGDELMTTEIEGLQNKVEENEKDEFDEDKEKRIEHDKRKRAAKRKEELEAGNAAMYVGAE